MPSPANCCAVSSPLQRKYRRCSVAEVERLAALIVQLGHLGLLAVLLYFILFQPERLDVWRAHTLRFFGWAGTTWRRRQIKSDLQGHINWFCKTIDREAPGTMPYNLKLQFVNGKRSGLLARARARAWPVDRDAVQPQHDGDAYAGG